MLVGELVEYKDRKWVERYELAKAGGTMALDLSSVAASQAVEPLTEESTEQ